MRISRQFGDAFKAADGLSFDRFRFDEPSYDMLVVNDENDYLEHLRVQGAAMAYYTALARQAERAYDEQDRRVRFRYNEMYAECSDILLRSGRKNNVRDIEAYVNVKYAAEIAQMYGRLDELREQRDDIQAFLEGWKQKSYILSSMTQMITAGLLTPRESITGEDMKDGVNTAREILSRNRKTE